MKGWIRGSVWEREENNSTIFCKWRPISHLMSSDSWGRTCTLFFKKKRGQLNRWHSINRPGASNLDSTISFTKGELYMEVLSDLPGQESILIVWTKHVPLSVESREPGGGRDRVCCRSVSSYTYGTERTGSRWAWVGSLLTWKMVGSPDPSLCGRIRREVFSLCPSSKTSRLWLTSTPIHLFFNVLRVLV